MNGRTVRKQKRFAFRQIWRDILFISGRLFRIGNRHENHVTAFHSLRSRDDFKSFFFGDGNGFTSFVKADDDFAAALFQIERVRMAL